MAGMVADEAHPLSILSQNFTPARQPMYVRTINVIATKKMAGERALKCT